MAGIEVEIWIWGVGSIFYIISVVGGVVNLIDDIYGGTLPVLKNEIEDVCLCPAVRKRNL